MEAFQQHVLSLNEVLQIYHLSGANDYMVHIGVKDAQTLRDFILDSFAERPEVAHIETAVIYEEVKNWQLGNRQL